MATKIYINTDLKDLTANAVANKNRPTQVVRLPQIVEGETLDVELSLVNSGGGYDTRSGDATVSLAVAVSARGAAATSGTFTLTASTETTAPLAWNASAEAVEGALNALNSGSGAYGSKVDVKKLNSGSYRIIFKDVGARTDFGGTSIDLAPESEVTIATAVVGSATIRAQMIIEISQQPAIYTSTWTTGSSKFSGQLNANTARVQELIATGQDAFFEVKADDDVICQVPIAVLPAVAAPNSLPAHTLPSNLNDFANDPSTNGNFNAANWLTDLLSPHLKAVWGNITGTLSDQTDLQTALDAKGSASQQTTNTADIAAIPFKKVDLAGGKVAYIGGDQTGNTRGEDSLDIQSSRDGIAQIAKGGQSIVVGSDSLVTSDKSYSFGRSNEVKASNSIALGENVKISDTASASIVTGRICDVDGTQSVVYGSSISVASDSGNNVAVGKTIVIDSDADSSVSMGTDINMQGSNSSAFGYNLDILKDNSCAIGRNVRVNAVGVSELGGWSSDGDRDCVVRCADGGVVSSSLSNVAFSPLDGGTTAGNELASQIPREMVSIRRSGDEVLADVNIAGVVKTVSFGDATRIGTSNAQASRTSIGSAIQNNRSDSVTLNSMRQMTQADYTILVNASQVDANTVYIIVG